MFNFDSVIKPIDEINPEKEHYLLETDNILVFPVRTFLRLVITAEDVIHSWTIPAFGVKLDAVPGRLNTVYFTISKVGYYFGQCSEICGEYHSAMPIEVLAALKNTFFFWFFWLSE